MRKDVREFIRRREVVGLTVEPTPGHYRVLREGEPLRKANGMPFTLPFSLVRWRRSATRQEARTAVFDYVEAFYNPVRLHSTLDYLSSVEYEKLNREEEKAA